MLIKVRPLRQPGSALVFRSFYRCSVPCRVGGPQALPRFLFTRFSLSLYSPAFISHPGAGQATARDTRAPRLADRARSGLQRWSSRSPCNLWGSGSRILLPPGLRASPLQATPCCFQIRVSGARSSGSQAPAHSRALRSRSPAARLRFPLLWYLAASDSHGSPQVRWGRKVSLAAVSAASGIPSMLAHGSALLSRASDASSPQCGPEPATASLPALYRRPRTRTHGGQETPLQPPNLG
ncbi:hypothetical protein NDU88_003125 [Pleurodeles waltl]|uniref:Uncharacterized protein n=1 Tax=Pleurodeles waltl TaxID=8319 RepID=A0AAV7M4H0_PLEWA|nr:hypothetical protein NDU88_003125 [Pleurodeles waltl]